MSATKKTEPKSPVRQSKLESIKETWLSDPSMVWHCTLAPSRLEDLLIREPIGQVAIVGTVSMDQTSSPEAEHSHFVSNRSTHCNNVDREIEAKRATGDVSWR